MARRCWRKRRCWTHQAEAEGLDRERGAAEATQQGGGGWIHGNSTGDLIRIELGGGDAGGGGLTCEGAGASVVLAVSLEDTTAEGEVAWEAVAAAVSPMKRRDSRAKLAASRAARCRGTGETLPASCLADFFRVENAGKRAVIPRLMGFQTP